MQNSNIEIKIDYFSATFPLNCDADDSVLFKVHEMVKLMAQYLNVNNFEIAKTKYAQNNFNHQYILGEHMILRLDGPMNDCYQRTCHLELKGEGCRDFEKRNPDKSWINFMLFMVQLNARFKRIDIAIDDFSGKDVTIGWLWEKIQKKYYKRVLKIVVVLLLILKPLKYLMLMFQQIKNIKRTSHLIIVLEEMLIGLRSTMSSWKLISMILI